ncbi:toll/interleukin-1 receptor domain-containing protein [Exilibacterium tricleocarpae]|uniref:toll/interleukin-1 receptor domain-containing protein n=1 Tax=Exilibacterium tricleocarpae TaxID=2591008 RepID=UPI0015D37A27|nr:toll/interleukin-1 receptor domain-containing protein [Exilibacterium tricleocarpae]
MSDRNIVFISKATPEDDEFVLWLAPKLEAAGYTVFADVLSLKAGDRWRKEVTASLRDNAIKMLLCCNDTSLAKDGVQEEIGIALDLSKELNDKRFIIPLRLERYKKIFGIGELQYINFVGSWANGLAELLDELDSENVPKNRDEISINPNWELYRQRFSIHVQREEELLTSNLVKILNFPSYIYYYEPTGAIDLDAFKDECSLSKYPVEVYHNGVFTFMGPDEINALLSGVGKFKKKASYPTENFISEGASRPKIKSRETSNLVSSMFRQAWNSLCREKGLTEYAYSSQLGFHFNKSLIPLKKRVPWGDKADRRSSALRGTSKGKVWEYGVTAIVSFWPFPHVKLKARVLFSELSSNEAGSIINDPAKQHKLRRSTCSGWRNKQWHGRLMAYLVMLLGDNETLYLPLSFSSNVELSGMPVILKSPVTTQLPNNLDDEDEEADLTTLGNFDIEEDD